MAKKAKNTDPTTKPLSYRDRARPGGQRFRETLLSHEVETGDLWRMCQTKRWRSWTGSNLR